jgi:hypothetical protein
MSSAKDTFTGSIEISDPIDQLPFVAVSVVLIISADGNVDFTIPRKGTKLMEKALYLCTSLFE